MIDKVQDRIEFLLRDFPDKRRNEILRNAMHDRVATPPAEPTSLREVWSGPTLTEQVTEKIPRTELTDEMVEGWRKQFEAECYCAKYQCGPFRPVQS